MNPPLGAITVTLDAKAIGARIRKARKARGWSLAELARRVSVQRMTVACWECGARVPKRESLVALVLRRKLDWLVLGQRGRAR